MSKLDIDAKRVANIYIWNYPHAGGGWGTGKDTSALLHSSYDIRMMFLLLIVHDSCANLKSALPV